MPAGDVGPGGGPGGSGEARASQSRAPRPTWGADATRPGSLWQESTGRTVLPLLSHPARFHLRRLLGLPSHPPTPPPPAASSRARRGIVPGGAAGRRNQPMGRGETRRLALWMGRSVRRRAAGPGCQSK